MPTWQGMEFLERAMDALLAQEIDLPWDITVVDSSSTDGTWEYLQGRAAQSPVPMTLHRIHGVEFDHGDTRNLMASMSRGDLLVFLTQDAIPAGPAWLRTLVANFEDPKVGGAYCRNVPRPDARLSTRILSATDPGYATEGRVQEAPANYAELTPDEQRLLYNFNDVASAVRRELWQRHPFPRTNFGEDVLMARALIEGGFQVVYDAVATVEHSHDYDPAQNRARGEIDGRFNAQWLGRVCLRTQGDVEFLLGHFEVEDKKAVEAEELTGEAAEAVRAELRSLRRALFEGLQVGSQDPLRRPRTRLRADDRLKILYVVHGFPPDTWAGTEIYCLNLARGMAENGHEVTILAHRRRARSGELCVDRGEFEGLRVLRMVNHLNHRNLTDSYRDDRAEAVFARVLGQFRPDVVHFST
ncbi:MAG: glycosyltransferase [Planctomycetota bacterium]